LGILNNVSVTRHSLGIFSFAVAVLAAAPKHQTAKFVFTTFTDNTGGWSERASSACGSARNILRLDMLLR
jgi:coproporphyrinogen III oxidase-like Fe-S oxidoreductase